MSARAQQGNLVVTFDLCFTSAWPPVASRPMGLVKVRSRRLLLWKIAFLENSR